MARIRGRSCILHNILRKQKLDYTKFIKRNVICTWMAEIELRICYVMLFSSIVIFKKTNSTYIKSEMFYQYYIILMNKIY